MNKMNKNLKHNVVTTKLVTKSLQDLLKHRYHTMEPLWFSDTTKIKQYWLMAIMDSATRRVVAFRVKESTSKLKRNPFNSDDFISLINESLMNEQKPKIIHTDQGGEFISKKTQKYLTEVGIQQSTTEPEVTKFGNQMIERLWRTLKTNIYKKIKSLQINIPQATEEAIKEYNDSKHKALVGLTPNTMQDALAHYSAPEEQLQMEEIVAASGSEIYKKQQLIKATVVQKYANNWIQFFVELKQSVQSTVIQQANRIIEQQKQESDRIIQSQTQQIQQLNQQINSLKNTIEYLKEQERERAARLKAKEEAKLRRRQKVSLPARDAATLSEREVALQYINKRAETHHKVTPFVQSRDTVAVIILYLFGIRISNLLLITARHLYQILEEGKIDLEIIKSRVKTVKTLIVPPVALNLIEEYKQSFEVLISTKELEQHVFTQENNNKRRVPSYLDKRINHILSHVSKVTKKNIRAHSFRIGRTTALIESVGIDTASKIIGHKDIRTTEMYSRRVLNEQEISNALNKALAVHKLKAQKRSLNTQSKRKSRAKGQLKGQSDEYNKA